LIVGDQSAAVPPTCNPPALPDDDEDLCASLTSHAGRGLDECVRCCERTVHYFTGGAFLLIFCSTARQSRENMRDFMPETIAREPYFAYLVLHFYETLGLHAH
jgi:hypothetical protein